MAYDPIFFVKMGPHMLKFVSFFVLSSVFGANLCANEHQDSKITQLQSQIVEANEALDHKEYQRAERLFKKILSAKPQTLLPQNEYFQILLSKAYTSAQLGHYKEVEALISQMDDMNLDETERFQRGLLDAKLKVAKDDFVTAMKTLVDLQSKRALSMWAHSERTFYLQVSQKVRAHYDLKLEDANRLFEKENYLGSRVLYQEIFQALKSHLYQSDDGELYRKTLLRIAQCGYKLGEYEKARELLKYAYTQERDYFDQGSLYLLILSCVEAQKPKEVTKYCREYLNQGPHNNPAELERVHVELGKSYIQSGEVEKGISYLQDKLSQFKNPENQILSRLAIADGLLHQKQPAQVKNYLHPSFFQAIAALPYKGRAAFLRGRAHYELKAYDLAIASLEEALEMDQRDQQAIHEYLGFAYYKSYPMSKSLDTLKKAQQYLLHALETNPALEECMVSLAHVCYLRKTQFKDSEAARALKAAMDHYPLKTYKNAFEVGLLFTQISESFEERESVFNKLSQLDGIGQLERERLAFFHGKSLYKEAIESQNVGLYSQVLFQLEETFCSLYTVEPGYLKSALQMMAVSAMNSQDPDLLDKIMSFFESFAQKYPEFSTIDGVNEELLYYHGLMGSTLLNLGSQKGYERGKSALTQLLNLEGVTYKDQVLYLLATLEYDAQEYDRARHRFLKVIETYPDSEWIPDAWFWAAFCIEHQKHDPQIAREYRRHVFEDYKTSLLAPEAYYRYYSERAYEKGEREALSHLEKMGDLFPNSPYQLTSFYFHGLHKMAMADYAASIGLFQTAETLYEDKVLSQASSSQEKALFEGLYHKSKYSRAEALLKLAEHEKGEVRQSMIGEAISAYQEAHKNILSTMKPEEFSYPELLEKIDLALAFAWIKTMNFELGEQKLHEMKNLYTRSKVKGSHSFQVFLELGRIAMAKQDFLGAIELFDQITQPQSEGDLEDYIEIHIQKSLCYKALGEFDNAIMVLSNLINEFSEEKHAVKAMFIRAELYELQGRREMAQKQLQVAAKKEGEWAKMSKDRLMALYEFGN